VDVLVDGCVLEVGTARGLVGLPQFALPHLGTIPPDITPWWG
jgi:hypothetical protein